MLKRSEEAKFMPGVWVFPGGSVDRADGEDEAGHRACAVRELSEEAGIDLPPDEELVLFSRWVTPEVVATRFDAWFFLALAPAHTPPRADGVETIDAAWFEPARALEMQEADELRLSFPTIQQLRWLSAFATADEALAAYRGRDVASVTPRGRPRRRLAPHRPPRRARLRRRRSGRNRTLGAAQPSGKGSRPACQGPGA